MVGVEEQRERSRLGEAFEFECRARLREYDCDRESESVSGSVHLSQLFALTSAVELHPSRAVYRQLTRKVEQRLEREVQVSSHQSVCEFVVR